MFNPTKEERRAVLFLAAVAFLGISVKLSLKMFSSSERLTNFTQDIGKVDLNSADKELLKSVPGIGEKLALRILEYRQEQTDFSCVEKLKEIKGMSELKFEKIKEYVTVK